MTQAQQVDRVYRVKYRLLGGHYHCSVFSSKSRDHTYAKMGDLVIGENELSSFLHDFLGGQKVEVFDLDDLLG